MFKSKSLLANRVIVAHIGCTETEVLYGVQYETDKFFMLWGHKYFTVV